jgi:hypothetical protein
MALCIFSPLLGLSPIVGRADTFKFTYFFQDGSKVMGSINGDWGGQYLENLTGASWRYYLSDGTGGPGAYVDAIFLDLFGPQLVPTNGSTTGLRLDLEQDTNGQFNFNFSIGPGYVAVGSPSADWSTQLYRAESPDQGWWSLERPPGVPDSGSTSLLLACGLAAMAFARRRLKRSRTHAIALPSPTED